MESHLLQMRGLKLPLLLVPLLYLVASFTDAWIETIIVGVPIIGPASHLLQMRGLKHFYWFRERASIVSHLLQMRGLKQSGIGIDIINFSRIFYRCVD